ncbi:hypothetical protein U9M48_021341 [Paspalum notatum var. saurae]|uniref:Small ribosomal subunit protein uS8c n=1 Tax=Paspalum notatum var. saurae TaxID=547442 RepID=A0AAQ3TK80_PASNO
MGRRILNEALRKMVNADRRGKATALLQPISGVMVSFLNIMKHRGYIKNFEVIDPKELGKLMWSFLGWGYVVVTTPSGVLDHEEAIKQNVGGQVLGYFH